MSRFSRHKTRILVAVSAILAIFILTLGITLSHPGGFAIAGGVPPTAPAPTATKAPAATATTAPAPTATTAPAATATTAPAATATSTSGGGSTSSPNPNPPGCPFNPFNTACNVGGVPSWVYCLVLLGLIILLLILVFALSRRNNNRNQSQNPPPRQPSSGTGGTPAAGGTPSS
jgi:hypothetical protein